MDSLQEARLRSARSALIHSALNLLALESSAGVVLAIPDTTPPVYIVIGDTSSILAMAEDHP